VLEEPAITSVRLITNAEKMVLRESRRAFVYFSLHALGVDSIVVNRLIPEEVRDQFREMTAIVCLYCWRPSWSYQRR
jgi:arsenite/tail-anchored protein-transporting ATPase